MTITILCILIYQAFTGLVEGNKNLWKKQIDKKHWYDSDGWYHAWRATQGLCIVIGVIAWPGLSWLHFFRLAAAWIGGNALYNRILCGDSQGSLFEENLNADGTPADFKFGPWALKQRPIFLTGWTELAITFPVFAILAFII